MGKLFNLPGTKQFHITTRFYDPQKEAMKEREERLRRELEGETDAEFHYGAGIKGSFRKAGRAKSKTLEDARRKSNKRILYILVALLALLYLFLK